MKKQFFNYDDWFSGKVMLSQETYVHYKNKKVVRADNACFRLQTLDKIHRKQKELFWEAVNLRAESLRKQFQGKCKNSALPRIMLRQEIGKCKQILINAPERKNFVELMFSELIFEYDRLIEIQRHVGQYIIGGALFPVDFVNSPYNKLKANWEQTNSVYAESVWRYYNYLSKLLNKITSNGKPTPAEPDNPFKDVFVDGYAYEAFKKAEALFDVQDWRSGYGGILYRFRDAKMIREKVAMKVFSKGMPEEARRLLQNCSVEKFERKGRIYNSKNLEKIVNDYKAKLKG